MSNYFTDINNMDHDYAVSSIVPPDQDVQTLSEINDLRNLIVTPPSSPLIYDIFAEGCGADSDEIFYLLKILRA